jgi:hypothetical protein
MRVFFRLLIGAVFVMCTASGCGPALTEEDLGTVTYEREELPTTGETYPPPLSPHEVGEHSHDEG